MYKLQGDDRYSGLDLLRVLAVLLIVLGHIHQQTPLKEMDYDFSFSYIFSETVGHFSRTAINCFIMISGWFLCDKRPSARRFLSTWIAVFLVNTVITCIIFAIKVVPFNIVYLVQAMLPIMGRPQWYMCEYLLLLLIHPFLAFVCNKLELFRLKTLLFFMMLFMVIESTIPIDFTPPFFSELMWFIFIFLLMYYVKRSEESQKIIMKYRGLIICGGAIGGVIIVLFHILADYKQGASGLFFKQLADWYSGHYEALPGFIISVSLFMIFYRIRWKTTRIVKATAASSGTIYMIHSVPVFWRYEESGYTIWSGLFRFDIFIETGHIVEGMLLCTLLIIVSGVCIHYAMFFLIDRLLRTKAGQHIISILDKKVFFSI